MLKGNRNKLLPLVITCVFVCLAISFALIFQKIILPSLQAMHAPGSVFTYDSAYFDGVASSMAETIRQHGWQHWKLVPTEASAPNVGLLAALYAIFGHDTTLAIPMNAIFHALGGLLVFLLAYEATPNCRVGRYAGLVSASLFVLFPSALNWYGQIHKDGFSIVGMLLLLLVWVRVVRGGRGNILLFLTSCCALVFIVSFRPYYLDILLVFVLMVLVALLSSAIIFKKKMPILFFAMVCAAILAAKSVSPVVREGRTMDHHQVVLPQAATPQAATPQAGMPQAGMPQAGMPQAGMPKLDQWEETQWIPGYIDKKLREISITRNGLIDYSEQVKAGSLIDGHIRPHNAVEAIGYFPRAFLVGVAAPFPSSWVEARSVTKLIASAEMLVTYICLLGLVFFFRYGISGPSVFMACFAGIFLLALGFALANVGTLYRVRYAFEFIMVMLGVIGWFTWLDKLGALKNIELLSKFKELPSIRVFDIDESALDRQGSLRSGVIIGVLTLVGFLVYFIRDVVMLKTFGLGVGLDDFFAALVIPMFAVSVFCLPLGGALIPHLMLLRKEASIPHFAQSISSLSALILIFLLMLCGVVFFMIQPISSLMHLRNATGEQAPSDFIRLATLALVILWLSGAVVLGNAALTAMRRLALPSAAQLIVPLVALAGLVIAGKEFGVVAVMVSMIIGQVLNLFIVEVFLRKEGVSLLPRFDFKKHIFPSGLLKHYIPLMAAGFFSSVSLPINTLFSSTLSLGSLSAFGFGAKVVLFVSGLLGAVMAGVMLPYFCFLAQRMGLVEARKELAFFLLNTTFVSIIASVLLFVFAPDFIAVILGGGEINIQGLSTIATVIQYSVIQIPFLACNFLLLKFSLVTGRSKSVMFSSLSGMVANIALCLLLAPIMGVAGIALSMTISTITSTLVLMALLVYWGYVYKFDLLVIVINWLLFLTLLLSLHFKSLPSVVSVIIAYASLVIAYWVVNINVRWNLENSTAG